MNVNRPYLVAFCIAALLGGCSIPKHHFLKELEGFNDSGCALVREGGKVWAPKYSKGLNNNARRVTFFQAGNPGGRGMREDDVALPVGTRLRVEDIRTGWDFENGNRLFITGMLVGNAKDQPFYFEEYTSSNDVSLVHKFLAPCQAPHGL